MGRGSYPSDKVHKPSLHDSWKQTFQNQKSKTQERRSNANIIDKAPFFESVEPGHSQRVCKRRLLISPPSSRLSPVFDPGASSCLLSTNKTTPTCIQSDALAC